MQKVAHLREALHPLQIPPVVLLGAVPYFDVRFRHSATRSALRTTRQDRIAKIAFRTLRALSGWSREELATRASVSPSTVENFEGRGSTDSKVYTLEAMLGALGINLADWHQLKVHLATLDAKVERARRGESQPAEIAELPPELSDREISEELGRAQARFNLRLLEVSAGRHKPDG